MKMVVVEIKDHEGTVTFEAVEAGDVAAKKKELTAAYREALREYKALSGDEKANAKKPVQPIMKTKKKFSELDKAAKCAMDMQKKYEEKKKG